MKKVTKNNKPIKRGRGRPLVKKEGNFYNKTFNLPEKTIQKIKFLSDKMGTKEGRTFPLYEVIIFLVDKAVSDNELKKLTNVYK